MGLSKFGAVENSPQKEDKIYRVVNHILDLAEEGSEAHLPLLKTARGRKPVPELHTAFLVSDDDIEIYWPKVGNMVKEQYGWTQFRPDQEKIRFYSRTFETKRCE